MIPTGSFVPMARQWRRVVTRAALVINPRAFYVCRYLEAVDYTH